ncbi:MAG: response regulator receiver domain [Acidobacteriota bacterium]
MRPEPSTYDELAQSIIRDYLRSAVIIDDHWPDQFGSAVAGDASTTDESSLIEDQIPEYLEEEELEKLVTEFPLRRQRSGEDPDANLLSKIHHTLIETGLLTCGLRYIQNDRDKAIRLAQSADIVVLDWHLVDDDGAEALEILRALKGDHSQGQALRFVCIFTGNAKISEVRTRLNTFFELTPSSFEESNPNLRIDNLVIAIRNKEGGATGNTPFTVAPDSFLEEVLKGISENYGGLVQLTMLELTQHHRRHLPAILERLDSNLDAAVLLEVGDEKSPVGRGGSFLAILIDEWRAHLEQTNKQLRALDIANLKLLWRLLAEKLSMVTCEDLETSLIEAGFSNPKKAKSIAGQGQRESLQRWLMSGFSNSGRLPRGIQEKTSFFAERGIVLAAMGLKTEKLNESFLCLDALFHQQFEKPLALSQGTLVADERASEAPAYLLCITPSCDADRPREKIENLFTFLRTKEVDTPNIFAGPVKRSTYCVIRLDSGFLCLEIYIKQKVTLKIADRFFGAEGIIQGIQPLDRRKRPEKIKLKAVAQLRIDHALAVTAASAADGSRVGVNRVERIRSRLS